MNASIWPPDEKAPWSSRVRTDVWRWWTGEAGVLTRRHRIAEILLMLLVAALPLGTRLIVMPGEVAGHVVEWGTLSLFGTQLLAAAVVLLTFSARPQPPKLAMAVAGPLTAAVILATFVSGHVGQAAATAWWLLLGLVVWVAVIALRPSVKAFGQALVASACLKAVIGSGQFAAQAVHPEKWLGMAAQVPSVAGVSVLENADGRWLRAYGTMAHPNLYGFFVAIGLLAAAHAVMAAKPGVRRWWPHLLVGLLALGLLVSYSRSAWLAAFVGLSFLIITHSVLGRGWHHAATALTAVVAIFLVATVAEPNLVIGRLVATGRLEQLSIEQRVNSFADGQRLLADNPLTGAGPGLAVNRLEELTTGRAWWEFEPPHFLPLAVAADVGLLGLLAWLLMIGIIFRHIITRAATPEAFLLLAIILAMGTAACFDPYFWTAWPGYLLFWLVMGFGVVAVHPPSP
jgi:O-antigen ligase